MAYQNIIRTAIIALSVVGLSACEHVVHEPTKITDKRAQVVEDKVFEQMPAQLMDKNIVDTMVQHYTRYGDGAIDLSVTYDPRSKTATAMHASSEVARIAQLFAESGLRTSSANIIPVKDQGEQMNALVSYSSFEAIAPEDCEVMPGMTNRNIEPEEDYELGCTLETVFAKQIARPKDLAGRTAATGDHDGRRASNVLEGYRSGVPNEPLAGENASE